MSFLLNNQLDKAYILKLNQDIKILRSCKIDWTVQDVIRFANLIKIDHCIGQIIKNYEIDGNKLFDIQYLSNNLESVINEKNFMPFYKLFFIVTAILDLYSNQSNQKLNSQKSKTNNNVEGGTFSEQNQLIEIEGLVIIKLKQEFQKLNNIGVLQLSTTQLSRILKTIGMQIESESIKTWNVDGFSLICIIGNESENQTFRNYYSDEQVKLLTKLSQLFMHIYFYQYQQQMTKTKINRSPTQSHIFGGFDIQFANIIGFSDPKRSIVQSEFGMSEDGLKQSEFGEQHEQIRNSQYGVSVRGSIRNSQYGVSQRGSVRNSQYGQSQTDIRHSIAESYATSDIMQNDSQTMDSRKQSNNIVVSSIEDDSTLATLMHAALNLPFNLLNLQPLQRIKICSIPYPFNLIKGLTKKQTVGNMSNQNLSQLSARKTESIYSIIEQNEEIREFKVFNLTGAKFGRGPENDFSYPDELSISGKHAQIVFKDESYYIRDLGSKTGTFIYVSQKKPLILVDEQIIQLSYEVQLKVSIIKNDINEGIIKFQFKKPENESPYRAILKNNNTVRIGRSQKSHIKLANPSISQNHAEIKYEQGKFVMHDCNTRTGTWLRLSNRGVRSHDRRLSKQDIIRISSKKTFLIEDMTESIAFMCCDPNKYLNEESK